MTSLSDKFQALQALQAKVVEMAPYMRDYVMAVSDCLAAITDAMANQPPVVDPAPVAEEKDATPPRWLTVQEAVAMAHEIGNAGRVLQRIRDDLLLPHSRVSLSQTVLHYDAILPQIYNRDSTVRDRRSELNQHLAQYYDHWFLEWAGAERCTFQKDAAPRHSDFIRAQYLTAEEKNKTYERQPLPEYSYTQAISLCQAECAHTLRRGTTHERTLAVQRAIQAMRRVNLPISSKTLAAVLKSARETVIPWLLVKEENSVLGKRSSEQAELEPEAHAAVAEAVHAASDACAAQNMDPTSEMVVQTVK